MINIGLIPLDSRPCNTAWVVDLAKIGGAEVLMYPRNKCGTLLRGAKLDDILLWLEDNVSKMDYLIISSDGLSFGGLIQARLAQINLEDALKKFEIFKNIKEKYPQLKMYIFDTVMRTSITAFDEETEKYWAKMNRYSYLRGRTYFYNNPSEKEELNSLEKEIPSYIIETYLKARNVKFTLNKFFINYVKEGIFDAMILLQEDSMPDGIQKIEQQQLQKIIEDNQLENKVQFYNGTDEGAVVLLGKILTEESGKALKCYLHVPSKEVVEKCFLFEDRSFMENIEKMCKTIGFTLTSNSIDCDFILSIFGIKENQDLDISKYKKMPIEKNNEYQKYINEVNLYLKENKKVVLVDLLFPNGGSFELIQDIDYKKLTVYSSWNTASNSLGSALCQISAVLNNNDYNSYYQKLNQIFLYERIMDDCIYQYIVRRQVNEKLLKEKINIHNLENNYEYALELVKEGLKKYNYMIDNQEYDVVLPWKRMFEVEILIRK